MSPARPGHTIERYTLAKRYATTPPIPSEGEGLPFVPEAYKAFLLGSPCSFSRDTVRDLVPQSSATQRVLCGDELLF